MKLPLLLLLLLCWPPPTIEKWPIAWIEAAKEFPSVIGQNPKELDSIAASVLGRAWTLLVIWEAASSLGGIVDMMLFSAALDYTCVKKDIVACNYSVNITNFIASQLQLQSTLLFGFRDQHLSLFVNKNLQLRNLNKHFVIHVHKIAFVDKYFFNLKTNIVELQFTSNRFTC